MKKTDCVAARRTLRSRGPVRDISQPLKRMRVDLRREDLESRQIRFCSRSSRGGRISLRRLTQIEFGRAAAERILGSLVDKGYRQSVCASKATGISTTTTLIAI